MDRNCAILEAARYGALSGSRIAFCKVYITNKAVRDAGVTLEDCLNVPAPQPIPVPVAVVPPTREVINPQVTIRIEPTPAPVQTVPQTATLTSIGGCPATRLNVCNREIDQALAYLAKDSNAEISIHGPLVVMGGFVSYVKAHGYSASRVRVSLDDVNTVDIGVWSTQ